MKLENLSRIGYGSLLSISEWIAFGQVATLSQKFSNRFRCCVVCLLLIRSNIENDANTRRTSELYSINNSSTWYRNRSAHAFSYWYRTLALPAASIGRMSEHTASLQIRLHNIRTMRFRRWFVCINTMRSILSIYLTCSRSVFTRMCVASSESQLIQLKCDYFAGSIRFWPQFECNMVSPQEFTDYLNFGRCHRYRNGKLANDYYSLLN